MNRDDISLILYDKQSVKVAEEWRDLYEKNDFMEC